MKRRAQSNIDHSHYKDFIFQTIDSQSITFSGKVGHVAETVMILENAHDSSLKTIEKNHWQWRHFATEPELNCLKNAYEQYYL